jgi:hypothetical protein
MRHGGFHFLTFNSQMPVRLLAVYTGCPLSLRRFLVLISVRGWVDPRAIVWLEGPSQLKNPETSFEF